MSLREKAYRGILWSLLEKWGSKAVSFAVFLLLASLLEPEAFGLIALAGVFVAFVQVFVEQGFGAAIVQRERLEPGHLDTVFWVNILFGLLLTGGGVAGAGLIARFFDQPALGPVVQWMSLSFALKGLSDVQQALFKRDLAFRVLSIRQLIAQVAGGVVGAGMALSGFGVWSLVGQQLSASGVGVVVLWTASDWRPGLQVSRRHFTDMFSFGINELGTNVLNFFSRRSDDLLIGYFLGPTLLGYYTVAYRILKILTDVVTSAGSSVAFPVFSRMQSEPRRLRQAFYTAVRYTSLISFPLFAGLFMVAPEIVPSLFGTKWAPSIPVLQVLAWIGLLHSIFFFNGPLIKACGKPSWVFANNLLNATVNVVSFMVVVRWGIVAVAGAYVARAYLLSPITLWMIRKVIGVDLGTYFRQYAIPFGGSLVMLIAIAGLRFVLGATHASLSLQLAVYVTAGALVYVLTVVLSEPLLVKDVASRIRMILPQRTKA